MALQTRRFCLNHMLPLYSVLSNVVYVVVEILHVVYSESTEMSSYVSVCHFGSFVAGFSVVAISTSGYYDELVNCLSSFIKY